MFWSRVCGIGIVGTDNDLLGGVKEWVFGLLVRVAGLVAG